MLRRLAKDCEFGAFLQEALRDRLVCGLSSDAIKKELLKDKDLTLAKACDTATAMQAAEADSSLMGRSQQSPANMNVLKKGGGKPGKMGSAQQCYCCGKAGHTPDDC